MAITRQISHSQILCLVTLHTRLDSRYEPLCLVIRPVIPLCRYQRRVYMVMAATKQIDGDNGAVGLIAQEVAMAGSRREPETV